MRVTLIWPKGFDPSYVFPLALGYLKANIDCTKHEVQIIDCALDQLSFADAEFHQRILKFKPDVVGISCWSWTFEETLRVAATVKSLVESARTIIGGCHATLSADSLLRNNDIDFVFRGEAETNFGRFLDELQAVSPDFSKIAGLCYKDKSGSELISEIRLEQNLDRITPPDYDALRMDEYIAKGFRQNTSKKRGTTILITRGCPFGCDFCSASIIGGREIRHHSIQYVIDLIKNLYYKKNIRQINILDDNFNFDLSFAKELCRRIVQLNLKDLCFCTSNGIRMDTSDLELFKLMKKAGWDTVMIAPESGSEETLKRMNKRLKLSSVLPKVKEIKKAGLKVQAFFVIGYPGDTVEDMKKTSELIKKCRFSFFFLNNFQPIPGTPVFSNLLKNGEISKDTLPGNYCDGDRKYVPNGLKNFNFAAYILREYLLHFSRNPTNIFYVLLRYNWKLYVRKLFSNLRHSCPKMFFRKPGLRPARLPQS